MAKRKGTAIVMDFSDDLVNLFESDSDGLFTAPQKAESLTPDDRLTASFRQITEFVETHDRLPDINAAEISEASLAARLNSIKSNRDKIEALRSVDSLGLLEEPDAPDSIDELFTKDSFGLFESAGDDILRIKNVPAARTRASAASVARRKKAIEFEKYKQGFIEMQAGLKNGSQKLIRFNNSNQIKAGHYYISLGLMVYVDKIGEKSIVRGAPKARTRLIFENGTESEMYDRSFAIDLYEDGYLVVDAGYTDQTQILADEDDVKGYIYILKSKSEDPRIATIKNLHKIGFSASTVTARIKEAEKDPTYLMSSVEVVSSYVLTGDYNPQKVEHYIHRIFADAKVDLKIIDKDGREYTPGEWYSVPQIAIEQAVNMLQSGDIVEYHYDKDLQTIVPNEKEG